MDAGTACRIVPHLVERLLVVLNERGAHVDVGERLERCSAVTASWQGRDQLLDQTGSREPATSVIVLPGSCECAAHRVVAAPIRGESH
jgi:hypothetical protein